MSKRTLDPDRLVKLDELKTLAKHEREIKRQLTAAEKHFAKEVTAIKQARRRVTGVLGRFGKRRAILQGRLSN